MTIRCAEKKDIPRVLALLEQVLKIHADLRPDLFIHGTTKYTDAELLSIFADDKTPVFVAADENDVVLGYAFCVLKHFPKTNNTNEYTSLYIDDLCVDEAARGQHIGEALFHYVKDEAARRGCFDVTLNVWAGNDGAYRFYEKMGLVPKKTEMEIVI